LLLACLDAFEYAQEAVWLERAGALADVLANGFLDPQSGAFRDRPHAADAPVATMEEPLLPIADAPAPSGNASAALGLLRLHALTQDERRADAAHGVLRAFAGAAARLGGSASTWAKALAWVVLPVTTIVVVDDGSAAGGALFAEARRSARPRTVVRRIRAGTLDPMTLP